MGSAYIERIRSDVAVRVVIAATGQVLQSKTFKGPNPPGCPSTVTGIDYGNGPIFSNVYGASPKSAVINSYAIAVSTQKV